MTITLQNMSLARQKIVQKHQAELDEYWQSFFTEVATVVKADPNIQEASINFNETHGGTVYVSAINIETNSDADDEIADTLIKIINTNMDSFLQDHPRLDSDDTIKVTASGIEGRFRRYGNWNVELPSPATLGL